MYWNQFCYIFFSVLINFESNRGFLLRNSIELTLKTWKNIISTCFTKMIAEQSSVIQYAWPGKEKLQFTEIKSSRNQGKWVGFCNWRKWWYGRGSCGEPVANSHLNCAEVVRAASPQWRVWAVAFYESIRTPYHTGISNHDWRHEGNNGGNVRPLLWQNQQENWPWGSVVILGSTRYIHPPIYYMLFP